MRIKRTILLITCISSLVACALNTATEIPANDRHSASSSNGFTFSPIEHGNTAELLGFIDHYGTLGTSAQRKTYMTVMQKLATDQNNISLKIKQAAMLAIPNSSLRDTNIAQQHLQSLLTGQSLNESNRHLVKLLQIFTLNDHVASQKLRDVSKKVESLKIKNKILDQKLSGLKDIEKTMIKRNKNTKK